MEALSINQVYRMINGLFCIIGLIVLIAFEGLIFKGFGWGVGIGGVLLLLNSWRFDKMSKEESQLLSKEIKIHQLAFIIIILALGLVAVYSRNTDFSLGLLIALSLLSGVYMILLLFATWNQS